MRYRDWRYLRSLGWAPGVAYRLLNLLANGVPAGEACRRAARWEYRAQVPLRERS